MPAAVDRCSPPPAPETDRRAAVDIKLFRLLLLPLLTLLLWLSVAESLSLCMILSLSQTPAARARAVVMMSRKMGAVMPGAAVAAAAECGTCVDDVAAETAGAVVED